MINIVYIIISFSFLNSSDNWNILSKEPVLIKYLDSSYPMCHAELLINDSIENVLDVIEDVNNYKLFFDSIVISTRNSYDQVRLGIDMPFPFKDRDYTVKFDKIVNENKISFVYEPIETENFPVNENYVRLIDARGGWILSKKNNKETLVIYKWNGDMRGGFPKWAYSQAWKKQGNEILLNLNSEVMRRKNK